MAVIHDKAGQKIFVFAQRFAVFHGNTDHFVACAMFAIPRAMLCGKDVAAIFLWKCSS